MFVELTIYSPQIAVRIIGPVLTVTVFASAVAYAWYEGHDVRLSNNVSPLLAVFVRVPYHSYLIRIS